MTLKVLCLPLPFNHEFDDYFWLMSNHLLRYFLDQSINQMFQWFFHFPIFHFHSLNLEHFLITLTTNFWTKVYFYQKSQDSTDIYLCFCKNQTWHFLVFQKKTARLPGEIPNQLQTTERNKYFYNTVSKNVKSQENQYYQRLQFLT